MEKLTPEIKKETIVQDEAVPKGYVLFAIMDGDTEVSTHITTQRQWDKSYSTNQKYKLKKKGKK